MNEGGSLVKLYSQMFTEYPDVVDVPQLCEMLGGVSSKVGYRLLHEKKIRSLRVGREYRIPKAYILEYLTMTDEQDIL